MKICILGWYGTETMGDRAILDGIFKIFIAAFGRCEFKLGSLYPFFTERTVLLDKKDWDLNLTDSTLEIFDEKNKQVCQRMIGISDLIIMGGGPIMDLEELYIIRKSFRLARKKKKPTCLFGCGMGPLNNRRLISVAKDILKNTSFGIFRDAESLKFAERLVKYDKWYCIDDPAIYSISMRKKQLEFTPKDIVVMNFREQPGEYRGKCTLSQNVLTRLIGKLSYRYKEVILLPNHDFFLGGDDRKSMIDVANKVGRNNVHVIQNPLSLNEHYQMIGNAKACIGMRYHAVAMQTILCGNNYIIDYTDPVKGKIRGFINMLPNSVFYNKRYYNYTTGDKFDDEACLSILESSNRYPFEPDLDESILQKYVAVLRKVFL